MIPYEGKDLEALAAAPNYYDWIFDELTSWIVGDVIEYGAGLGTVSERLAPLAANLTLVEPDPKLANRLRIRFAGKRHVRLVCESLESHLASVKEDNTVDTVVLVNVLEHIEHDRQALAKIFRMLKPSGRLLLFVPAGKFLMGKLDLGFGHFRRYSKQELICEVRESGGDILSCRYFDLLGVVPWWVMGTLIGATSLNPKLVRLNDKVVVPIARLVDRISSFPFGKNLVLVAGKSDK